MLRSFLSRLRGNMKRRSSNIAGSAFIAPGVQILGLDQVKIGERCTIGENTLITINDRTSKHVGLEIGNDTYIGRNNFFTVGKYTSIGPFSVTGNNCSFLSSDHITTPLSPYMSTGATTGKAIRIGANCWLGFNVCVVGNVSIGHGSVVGANAVVLKDVPPFSLVVGNPARIIKRFNFTKNEWETGDQLAGNPFADEASYVDHLKKSGWKMPPAYHSASSAFGDI